MAYEMDFAPVLARAPELVTGTINTIILSAEVIAIGLTIGLAVALLRFDGPRWGRKIGAFYVEAFRNTPLLVQLFLSISACLTQGSSWTPIRQRYSLCLLISEPIRQRYFAQV
ncbi:amino ABC transporter, permease protein, 3-TM region, His/Glu/Gln/Arg/opine family [compost metagenome]